MMTIFIFGLVVCAFMVEALAIGKILYNRLYLILSTQFNHDIIQSIFLSSKFIMIQTKVSENHVCQRPSSYEILGMSTLEVDCRKLKAIVKKYDEKLTTGIANCGNIWKTKYQVLEDDGSIVKGVQEYNTIYLEKHNAWLQKSKDACKSYVWCFCNQKDPVVSTKVEIVNLTALIEYASDKRNVISGHSGLNDYIDHVKLNGINHNGLKKHEVKYYMKDGIGRRYAKGHSMQSMSIKLRTIAFANIGYDIDIVNAGISILHLILREKKVANHYPFIGMYASNPTIWKAVFSEFYEESISDSKIRLMYPLYGLPPTDNNPFLWRLTYEVNHAAKFLMSLDENRFVDNLYQDLKRPRFIRHQIILEQREDKLLSLLEERLLQKFPSANVSLLLFDGLKLFTNEIKEDIEKVLNEYKKETGISVIIKERWSKRSGNTRIKINPAKKNFAFKCSSNCEHYKH